MEASERGWVRGAVVIGLAGTILAVAMLSPALGVRLATTGYVKQKVNQLENEPCAIDRVDVVVDTADMRVIELRKNPRFSKKARLGHWIEPPLGTDRFERDTALQRLVYAGVHLAHATGPERGRDAVMRNDGSWFHRRRRHRRCA